MGTAILSDFKHRLEQECKARDLQVCRWRGPHSTSRNILVVGTAPQDTLLYVKVRSESPGFWGLTANRISELRASGSSWYAVLLVGSSETGYVLPSSEVESGIGENHWTLSADGDYKINEGSNLNSTYRFTSFKELSTWIFPIKSP